jgi:hypothetical protein
MKYRKKPVVVDAIRYLGTENYSDVCSFVGNELQVMHSNTDQIIIISTLEGDMRANEGDYIIKGVQGEFYPCKPDIFEETYEEVVD